MLEFENIKDVTKKAIRIIPDETKVYYPLTGKTEVITGGEWVSKYKMRYSTNNSIISFIDETSTRYVIPAINGVEETLKRCGFVKAEFNVPFSNLYAYPLVDKRRWEKLLAEMRAAA